MSDRVFVVDDHPVVRRGYTSLVERQPSMEICGEASTASEALDLIGELDPDLVLVDISLEGMGGIELIKHLQNQHSDLSILVISMHDEMLYAERALEAGARGYVMKGEADEVVLEAIDTVLEGSIYLSEEMNTRALLRRVGREHTSNESELAQLSDRELEVFEEMGKGLTTKEIAEDLFISPKTVGTYYRNIREKLNIESTAQLKMKAILWYHGRTDE